jgi:hypothetical protein
VFTTNVELRNLKDTDSEASIFSRPDSVKNTPFGFKQCELFLDDSVSYQEIRKEGRKTTWQEIKVSRKKLQRFIHRQSEYKKIFDMMLSYYK